ncbi:MAG TPA: hypothetical protein VIJ34_01055 [Acidimicrobiales bacterium]
MNGRLRRFGPRHGDSILVSEAEQFLSGSLLDVAFESGGDVPAWVWLSAITHGDAALLAHAKNWLSDHQGARPELNGWGRVLQHLTTRLLETSEAMGCPASDLQRDLLVPLELAVTITPVGPATMCRLVNVMLIDAKTKIGLDRS